MLIQTNGFPTVVAELGGEHSIQLLSYPDGSWGIRIDRHLLHVWEKGKDEDCWRLFLQLIGLDPDDASFKHPMPTRTKLPTVCIN